MKRPLFWLVVVALVAGMTGCGTSTTLRQKSETCQTPRLFASGASVQSFASAGRQHRYELYVPPGYNGKTRLPVMVTFHGFGGDPTTFLATTRLTKLAAQRNFIVVTPRGTGEPSRWNFRNNEGSPATDVGLVHDLVRDVRASLCTNPDRFYASGFSNGAVMALTLACDPRGDFAAVGAVAGPWFPRTECEVARPASVVYIHGTRDRIAPFQGGETLIGDLPAAETTIREWAEHDGCQTQTTTDVATTVKRIDWRDCLPGGAVTAYIVRGGGHAWPGGDETIRASDQRYLRARGLMSQDLDASKAIWDFVSRVSR